VNRPRAVIDTNLVLSALLFSQSRLTALRKMWQQGHFRPLISKATTTELIKVLAYPKFQLTISEQKELLADYLPWCMTITMPHLLPDVPDCRDPYDRPFLQLAMYGKADYLVTGDHDLLCLSNQFSLAIIDAQCFLKLFRTCS
jgi:uncharacterized protein